MTKVDVIKDEYIKSVKVYDHSDFDEHGFDIVCSSISSMTILAFNICESLNSDICEVREDDCFVEIVIDGYDNNVDIVLTNFINLVKELEEQYPNNISLL